MKKIEAIIQEERLNAVKKGLEEKGFIGLTVTNVSGRGQQRGISLQWRVGEYRVDLLPKIKVEVVVSDKDCQTVIEIILETARTGNMGDGMVFVLPVEQIYRVRTGQSGESVFTQNSGEQLE